MSEDTHVPGPVSIEAVFLPTDRFKAYCLEVNALKALDRLDNLNRVPLSLSNLASFQRQFRAGQDGQLKTSAGLYGFMVTLLEDPEDPPLEGSRAARTIDCCGCLSSWRTITLMTSRRCS